MTNEVAPKFEKVGNEIQMLVFCNESTQHSLFKTVKVNNYSWQVLKTFTIKEAKKRIKELKFLSTVSKANYINEELEALQGLV